MEFYIVFGIYSKKKIEKLIDVNCEDFKNDSQTIREQTDVYFILQNKLTDVIYLERRLNHVIETSSPTLKRG